MSLNLNTRQASMLCGGGLQPIYETMKELLRLLLQFSGSDTTHSTVRSH